jgi:hypothetical protein
MWTANQNPLSKVKQRGREGERERKRKTDRQTKRREAQHAK